MFAGTTRHVFTEYKVHNISNNNVMFNGVVIDNEMNEKYKPSPQIHIQICSIMSLDNTDWTWEVLNLNNNFEVGYFVTQKILENIKH